MSASVPPFPSDRPVRYALIGAGMMGFEHLRNLGLVPGARVTAVADPVAEQLDWARFTLEHHAADKGAGVAYLHDPREILERDLADAIIIASPNHTHFEVLQPFMASGAALLVEKPLCTTLEHAVAIEQAARERSGLFWVGLEYRYMPPVTRFIERLHGGEIGTARMLAIREHRFPFLKKVGDWNRFNRNTGGTLVEKCCHFFDLMRVILEDEPVRVMASGAQDVNHLDEVYDGQVPDILDNAFVTVEFARGARALLDLCMFAEGSSNQEELSAVGPVGKLEVFIPEGSVVASPRNAKHPGGPGVSRESVPVSEHLLAAGHHHGATYYQLLDFHTAFLKGRAAKVDAHDGLLSVAMGLAAHRSIDERRIVEMSEMALPERPEPRPRWMPDQETRNAGPAMAMTAT